MKDRNISNLKNIFVPSPSEFGGYRNQVGMFEQLWSNERRKITLEEIPQLTTIYRADSFTAQQHDDTTKNCGGIYYIQKYKKAFLYDEMYDFVESHPEENFLIMQDEHGNRKNVYVFIKPKDYDLRAYFFSNKDGDGHLKMIAEMRNRYGKSEWDEPIVYDKDITVKQRSRWDSTTSYYVINFSKIDGAERYEYRTTQETEAFLLMNRYQSYVMSTTDIMKYFLKIPDQTRIVSEMSYRSYDVCYDISCEPLATENATKRYGIREEDVSHYGGPLFQADDVFPKADLPEETLKRVTDYIKMTIESGVGDLREPKACRNGAVEKIKSKGVLVISEPVGRHKRPTYHYIKGFGVNTGTQDAIDIVELARGELLMKDMTPVNCYYLNGNTGEYCRISNTLFGRIKAGIIETAEIDKVSLVEWSEEKSAHPELIKSMIESGQISELPQLKLLNKVPFGELFLEQMIKSGRIQSALALAEYIMERADNMNYVCGSLSDIFPGCDPAGTSLMKMLNMNKPCYDLLWEMVGEDTSGCQDLIAIYVAIKNMVADGVLTKEAQKAVAQYWELSKMGWAKYVCDTGRVIDLSEYRAEVKSIYKMVNKIKTLCSGDWAFKQYEMLRHYNEIVTAYFKFVDYGWNPSDYAIFIEFSLSGDNFREIEKMVRDREHAANAALDIYKDKINEAVHKKNEDAYAFRKKNALRLLESNESMAKKKVFENGDLNLFHDKYVVIAPSQVYGEERVGSIENEGKYMGHCVFRSYANKIAGGEYTVMYLRLKKNPDESLVTIGITKDGRINQTYGKNDCQISVEEAMAVAQWAKAKSGFVHFQGESGDVCPGGWNRGAALPSLPMVSKEWQERLAKTEK